MELESGINLQRRDAAENHFVCFLGEENFDLRLHAPEHMVAYDVPQSNRTRIPAT